MALAIQHSSFGSLQPFLYWLSFVPIRRAAFGNGHVMCSLLNQSFHTRLTLSAWLLYSPRTTCSLRRRFLFRTRGPSLSRLYFVVVSEDRQGPLPRGGTSQHPLKTFLAIWLPPSIPTRQCPPSFMSAVPFVPVACVCHLFHRTLSSAWSLFYFVSSFVCLFVCIGNLVVP